MPFKKHTIPNRLKAFITYRDKGICQNCGKVGKMEQYGAATYPFWRAYERVRGKKVHFEIGHIYPESDGGMNVAENLILMCRYCNRSLGNNLWRPPEQKDNI